MSKISDSLNGNNFQERITRVTRRRVGDVLVNEANPKLHGQSQNERLTAVLDKFGKAGVLLTYRGADGRERLFDGHARQGLNPEEMWFIAETDLNEQEVRELVLLYDPLAGLSEWREELVIETVQDLKIAGGDDVLEEMLKEIAQEAGMVVEDDSGRDTAPQIDKAGELQEKWQVKTGDIWQIGEHRLICGDCTDRAVVERVMGGELADCVIGDPPYGISYQPNHSKQRVKHGYNNAGYHNVIAQGMITGDDKPFNFLSCYCHVENIKEQFWFGADYYAEQIPIKNSGSWLVWDKRYTIEDIEFNTSHFELCWSKQKHLREILRYKWFGIQGTETQDVRNRIHPTQKPIQLIMYIVEKWGGDVVFDPYAGSGTVMVSCEKLNRSCVAIEIEPSYCSVILERMVNLGLSPVLVKDTTG